MYRELGIRIAAPAVELSLVTAGFTCKRWRPARIRAWSPVVDIDIWCAFNEAGLSVQRQTGGKQRRRTSTSPIFVLGCSAQLATSYIPAKTYKIEFSSEREKPCSANPEARGFALTIVGATHYPF